ncbi:hypothetical protein D3C85_1213260 [compost metagenome]
MRFSSSAVASAVRVLPVPGAPSSRKMLPPPLPSMISTFLPPSLWKEVRARTRRLRLFARTTLSNASSRWVTGFACLTLPTAQREVVRLNRIRNGSTLPTCSSVGLSMTVISSSSLVSTSTPSSAIRLRKFWVSKVWQPFGSITTRLLVYLVTRPNWLGV